MRLKRVNILCKSKQTRAKQLISWHRLPMTAYIVRRNPKINFLLQHSNRQELCCFHGNTMKYLTAVLSTLLLQPPDSWDKFFVPRLWIIIAFWYVVFIDHG